MLKLKTDKDDKHGHLIKGKTAKEHVAQWIVDSSEHLGGKHAVHSNESDGNYLGGQYKDLFKGTPLGPSKASSKKAIMDALDKFGPPKQTAFAQGKMPKKGAETGPPLEDTQQNIFKYVFGASHG